MIQIKIRIIVIYNIMIIYVILCNTIKKEIFFMWIERKKKAISSASGSSCESL